MFRPEKPPGETVYRFENTNGENAEVKPSLKVKQFQQFKQFI